VLDAAISDSDGSWCPCSGDKYNMTWNEEACLYVRVIVNEVRVTTDA
jgi:hypothetical protein